MNINLLEQLALSAMQYEVETTPKPGLVDLLNSGCHNDMDIHLFYKSITSLKGFYIKCAQLGLEGLDDCLVRFRKMGQEYLDKMYKATNNVNTHKGMIFSLGLVVLFTSYYLNANNTITNNFHNEILDLMKKHLEKPLTKEISNIKMKKDLTHGEYVMVKYNVGGIRQEVGSGFKSIRPILDKYIKERYNKENNIKILYELMKVVNDSQVLYRAKLEGLIFMKNYVNEVDVNDYEQLIKCDSEFTKRNISPGGCCDLLAICIFFILVKDYYE